MKKITLALLLMFCTFSVLAQTNMRQKQSIHGSQSRANTIKIFPNPATTVVNVLGLLNSSKAVITISNVYGTIVQEHQWEICQNALSIPIPNLEAGIYMISITSTEQKVQAKFYKQ